MILLLSSLFSKYSLLYPLLNPSNIAALSPIGAGSSLVADFCFCAFNNTVRGPLKILDTDFGRFWSFCLDFLCNSHAFSLCFRKRARKLVRILVSPYVTFCRIFRGPIVDQVHQRDPYYGIYQWQYSPNQRQVSLGLLICLEDGGWMKHVQSRQFDTTC